jgi:signal transduction histidine kinase
MTRMIDELLVLARGGRGVTDLEPVSLRQFARRAGRAVEGEIDLVVASEAQLRADPDRLTALLENLLRNAAEHAGPGPRVTVGPTGDGRAPADGTAFYLADDGPGIPPEERSDVFEHSYSTGDGGTGPASPSSGVSRTPTAGRSTWRRATRPAPASNSGPGRPPDICRTVR